MLSGVEAEHAARLAVMAAAPLVRADERARIAADLQARAAAIEDSNGENRDWLAEDLANTLPTVPIGGAVQADPRTVAIEAYRGIAFTITAAPPVCPQAAPESTQSPETAAVAPVYPPGPVNPAETLSALRKENTCLRREVAYITRTGEMWRRLWERVDGERSRECIRADQAEAAVARVRELADRLCQEPHPTHDHLCPDGLRTELLAALDGAGAVSEEQP